MSIEAMAIVLNHSKAKGAAKLVLMGIANHINPDNDGAWPSQAKLAGYANVSDRAVRDAIEQLVKLGELRYEVGSGVSANQYKPNRYWLILTCPDECDGTANHRVRVEVSAKQGGTFGETGWKQTSDKPLKEPLEKPNNYQSKIDIDFDEFWNAYPRKEYRLKVKKCFIKLCNQGIDPQMLIDGARRLAADPNLPEKTFIPNGEKWLNQGGWENGPLPPRIKSWNQLKEDEAENNRRKREIDIQETQKLIEQTRQPGEAPPICEHGKLIVNCMPCARKL